MIRKIHKIFLLTLLLSLASTLTFADEISATLEHTAGAGWASAAGNTPSVDGEQEYYNSDTPNGWEELLLQNTVLRSLMARQLQVQP